VAVKGLQRPIGEQQQPTPDQQSPHPGATATQQRGRLKNWISYKLCIVITIISSALL